MKTIRYYIFIFAGFTFGVMLFSCSDFLDVKPVSNGIAHSSDSVLYKTAADVESALAGTYNSMQGEYYYLDFIVNGDVQADNCYSGGDNPDNIAIDNFTTISTNGNTTRDWSDLFTVVGIATQVINNAPLCPDPALTPGRLAQIVGEASWLRAFNYFQLVQMYGAVPLQLQSITSISSENLPETYPLLFPKRTPVPEIYAQIIKDLETALAANLNPTPANKGYVTVGAANALLAKVYATQSPQDWTKVKQYCDAVIGGGYTLMPNYEDLWDGLHYNSAESIFEMNCDPNTYYNWGNIIFYARYFKTFNTPSVDLVNAYKAEGDSIRKQSSTFFSDVTGQWTDQNWKASNWPVINKFRDLSGGQSQIMLRLADIILLKAEALNNLADVNGAATLVNQIRTRVNLPNTPAADQASMALAIEKERRLELAYEGFRWFDLVRTGRALDVMNALVVPRLDGSTFQYHVTPDRLLFPVPQAQIDLNPQLTQNPGY